MGNKKRKGRSVRNNQQILTEADELVQAPHSFIIHRGLSGQNIVEITKDFRKVMEPFTAGSLKVSRWKLDFPVFLLLLIFRKERTTRLKISFRSLERYTFLIYAYLQELN